MGLVIERGLMDDNAASQCLFLSVVRENRQATTEWLAKYYVKEIRDRSDWPKEAMRGTFRRYMRLSSLI